MAAEAAQVQGAHSTADGRTQQEPGTSGNSDALLLSMEDFRDYRQIGKGKDSVIYACTCDKLHGRAVVLKVYDKAKVSAVKHRSIKREARIMKYLTYKGVPHVTEFIGAFQDKRQMYIVMEHASNGDLLEQLLKEGRAMSERRVASEVCLPILSALVHLHALGIIHRDIKLENIFVDASRAVQLGDFGLALCVHEERAISPVGTLEYMPPEILRLPATELIVTGAVRAEDVTPVTEKVDIWSFGVTVYELVTGRSPYEGASKEEIHANVLANRIRPLPAFLGADCIDFISKALTIDARTRPSAAQMLQHPWMQRHCQSEDIEAALSSAHVIAGPSRTAHTQSTDSAASTGTGVAVHAGQTQDAAATSKHHPAMASAAKAAAQQMSGSPRSDVIPAYMPSNGSSTAMSAATAAVTGNHSTGSTGSTVSMADSASSLHGTSQQHGPLPGKLLKQQEPIFESPAEQQGSNSSVGMMGGKGGKGSRGLLQSAGAKKLRQWMCIAPAPSDSQGERAY